MSAIVKPSIRKLTVDDYYLLAREGSISSDERTELVDGQIVTMFPIGFSHSAVQANLLRELYRQEDMSRFKVWPGGLRISDTGERYPDISLIQPTVIHQPTAKDFILLIEIADSSLAYDLTEKKKEYEAAGIREYWVVDAQGKTVFDFELQDGKYSSPSAKSAGSITVRAFPDVKIELTKIFG